jgi:hypothetical protein
LSRDDACEGTVTQHTKEEKRGQHFEA